jgi:hypothetical protein
MLFVSIGAVLQCYLNCLDLMLLRRQVKGFGLPGFNPLKLGERQMFIGIYLRYIEVRSIRVKRSG